MQEQEINWVDLSAYGLQVILTKLPNGKKFLVAWGADESAGEKLKEIGFISRPKDSTVWFASRDKLGSKFMNKVLDYFPNGKIKPTPISQILVPELEAWAKSKRAEEQGIVNEQKMKEDLTELRVELSQDLLIGTNIRGEKVYKTPEGRVCVGPDGETKMMNFKSDKSLFFIAGDLHDFNYKRFSSIAILKAVEPFAKEIAEGKIYHFEQLTRIVETIFALDKSFDESSENLADAGAEALLLVENALRISAEKFALDKSNIDSEDVNQAIDSLFERIPKAPTSYINKNRQVMNVIPSQADLIKNLVEGNNAKSIAISASLPGYLEASIPNSISVISHVDMQNINPAATDILNPTAAPNVKFIDRTSTTSLDTDTKQDFVFVNEPPATMKEKAFDGVTYSRKDLYMSAYNLMAMDDDGAAVIAIQEPSSLDGAVDGEFKRFMEWLYPRFGVKGAVDVSGSLYGRSGEENSVRLLYIEGRNLIPEIDVEVPTELIKVEDHEALRGLSNVWLNDSAKEAVQEKQANQENTARLSELLASSKDNDTKLKANKFQSPYIHTSKVNSGDSMVSKDLDLPSRKAHARLVRKVGDIDRYVQDKLQMTSDQLHRCFLGGQVCAIAQIISNIDEGKGFLLGDAPGQGKGRQLAAIIRYRLLCGEPVVFATEGSDLFRDLMRDLKDIESSHLVRPYVLDNEKQLVTMDGDVLDKGSTIRNDALLDGFIDPLKFNLYFVSYPQARDVIDKTQKKQKRIKNKYLPSQQFKVIELVKKAYGKAAIVADEVHNAASVKGNTNNSMERLLDLDNAALLSTGTSSRHIKNLSFYHRLVKPVSGRDEFREILAKGGNNVTTAFVQMLTEAGMYVRREEDLSKAIYVNKKDVMPVSETRELVNGAAKVFSLLAKLTGASQKHIFNNDNEDALADVLKNFGGRLGSRSALSVGSTHFSSRFNNLQSMFNTVIGLPTILDGVKESITKNEKPLVTFNNTGGSFAERYFEKMVAIAEASKSGRKVNEILAKNLPQEINGQWVFPSLPSMREVFYFAVEDSMRFKIDTGNKKDNVYVELGDLCTSDDGARAIQEAKAAIMDAIMNMPDISFAPVDQMHNELRKLGINSQEITGRKKGFNQHSSGGWVYEPLSKPTKNQIIDGFNGGRIDVLLLNVAGATGFSFHASPTFKDQRQRVMFFLEHMPDILKARQVENRINRLGQVLPPKYVNPALNTAGSELMNGVQNGKRAEFSACVTGSSEADSTLDNAADFMNKVGDRVCMCYLEENPDVMEKMGFDIDGFVVDGKYQFDGFSNRFKDALIRLDFDLQHEVYREVKAAYSAELEYLKSAGKDLNNKSDFNINATKLQEEVIFGEESDFREDAWKAPLKVRQIEYNKPSKTSTDVILREIDDGNKYLDVCIKRFIEEDGTYAELLEKIERFLENNRKVFVEKMDKPDPALIAKYDDKVKAILEVLPRINVGQIVTVKDAWDKTTPLKDGVITRIKAETKNPQDWSMVVDFPDGSHEFIRVRDVVEDLIKARANPDNKDEPLISFSGQNFSLSHPMSRDFDSANSSEKIRRVALVGNMLEAMKVAKELGAGTSGSYTDDQGVRHSCVMMPMGMTFNEIVNRPQPLKNSDNVLKYLAATLNIPINFKGKEREQVSIYTSGTGYSQTQDIKLTINKASDKITLSYPKNKKYGEAFKTPEFGQAVGPNADHEAKKSYNVVVTSMSRLEEVLEFIYSDAERRFFSQDDLCNFEQKIESGSVVVSQKDIHRAFSGTSVFEDDEQKMAM